MSNRDNVVSINNRIKADTRVTSGVPMGSITPPLKISMKIKFFTKRIFSVNNSETLKYF